MNMNLKGIMSSLGAQPGQVVSDPFARAFAPAPVVKEETINEEDHEVSMAQNQLDSIIKNATELKGKVGEQEKNIAGWIQDHITNAENYIEQANTGYHELEESVNEGKFKKDDLVYNTRTKTVGIVRMGDDKYGEVKTDADGNVSVDELEKYNPIKHKHQQNAKVAPSTEKEVNSRGLFNPFKTESITEEFKHIISVETPTQVVSKPIAAQIEKLAKQGVRSSEIGLKMGFVGNQKVATDAFQKLKNQIYFKLNKSESVNEDVSITNGDYHFWSKGGVAHLDYKGKEIASGDFDSGADAYFLSHSSFKGQKAFDSGKDVLNYFRTKRITDESVNEGLTKDTIVRTLTSDKNAYFLTKDGNGWILDITPKGAQNSTFHQKFTVKDMGKGHLGMKYRLSETKINEARLTDIVKTIVETPVIGKMVSRTPSTTQVNEVVYNIGAGWMGNGLTIWNKAVEEHGDYKIIAHIDDNGKVSIRDKEMPSKIRTMIEDWADAIKKGNK